MKVAIYARVSTANNGQVPTMQTRELEQFAQARCWQVVGCYVDTVSGSKDRRPELDRLMADAHKRKFAVVAVWEFDRFARSVSHLLRALETLNALGIAFASLTVVPDARRIAALREQGASWAKIAERLGISEGTAYRAAHAPAKISSSRRPVTHCGAVTN